MTSKKIYCDLLKLQRQEGPKAETTLSYTIRLPFKAKNFFKEEIWGAVLQYSIFLVFNGLEFDL